MLVNYTPQGRKNVTHWCPRTLHYSNIILGTVRYNASWHSYQKTEFTTAKTEDVQNGLLQFITIEMRHKGEPTDGCREPADSSFPDSAIAPPVLQ